MFQLVFETAHNAHSPKTIGSYVRNIESGKCWLPHERIKLHVVSVFPSTSICLPDLSKVQYPHSTVYVFGHLRHSYPDSVGTFLRLFNDGLDYSRCFVFLLA